MNINLSVVNAARLKRTALTAQTRKMGVQSNVIPFPGSDKGGGPQPTGPAQKKPPVRVLDCVRDAQTQRWLRGVKLGTIRRELEVSPNDAEEIVRQGVIVLRRRAS